ncbi:MAG: isopeptide-forming domain-containing fimbrial protein [Lachnospiraceae bacterium]|nr:isopeptide-forming domain-containing fimbrial protein [Lachnospiraceae bacterium]
MKKQISSKLKNAILKSMLAVLLGGVLLLTVNGISASAADNELTDETYLWSTLTNPAEDETGDVTLTVVTTAGETETYQYANIMDAVKKLFSYMNHGDNYQTTTSYSATTTWYNPNGRGYNWSDVDYTWDYSSAVISFTEAHCEYITTSVQFKSSTSGWQYASLSNVTFDGNGTGSIVGDPAQSWTGDVVVSGGTYGNAYGYGSYSNLKGTITISGDNCTIQNTSFIGNHTWAFTYYTQDNAIGVGSGVTGLTIKNNSFTGYTLVTAFGQSGGTVTNEVFTGNTVEGCLFLFHTADGGATNLTVTNNTLIGSAQYTLASCMAYTTIADFSGNTLTYASFGLQNCETDMEQFLTQNTYDHGYIYQETVDYSWTDEELGSGTYYYLPSETTVYTILPAGVYTALWVSDYDEPGSMDSSLTYTQQNAIDAAVAASEDPSCATLTWTGGGRDGDGNLLDGGVAIGYNYNALHLLYAKISEPDMDKSIIQNGLGVDQDDVAAGDVVDFELKSTIPDVLVDYIEYSAVVDNDGNISTVGTVENEASYTLTFHDVMDEELSLDADSIVIKIDGEAIDEKYYTITTSDLNDDCTFEVSIELLVLYTDEVIDESDFGKTSITVEYSAKLDENASAGAYYNAAWVKYPDGKSNEDTVEVDTYGISIFKYDQSDSTTDDEGNTTYAGLPDATFELRIQVSEDTEGALTDSEGNYYLVVDTLTSGDDGYATLEGLDVGTYFVVETKAPNGYVKADTILTIEIPTDVSEGTNIADVSFANAPVPSTGGMGTTIFRIVGLSLLLAAGAVYVITLRRRKED